MNDPFETCRNPIISLAHEIAGYEPRLATSHCFTIWADEGKRDNLPPLFVRGWEGVLGTFRQGLIAVFFVAMVVMLAGPAAADDANTCIKESGDVAIAACTRAITSGNYRGNNLAKLFYNRGTEYGIKADNDRAIQDYDQAIRFNPQYADAFNNRGVAYKGKGQYDRAIQDYDQAIRLNPQDANAFINRGNAYKGKGQYDRAIQNFDQAIRLNPKSAQALYYRGIAKLINGEANGNADIAAAKAINADIVEQIEKLGIRP